MLTPTEREIVNMKDDGCHTTVALKTTESAEWLKI